MLSSAEQNINNLALKLSAEAASTNNVSYETLISQWLDQVVLAEKTKAQMEARDIMRENLNKDFLYFSPSALPWAGKKGISALWKATICLPWEP